jgi:cytidine deaminase
MNHAYAPYSNFRVGAAILSKSGRVFSGCNVENASYGLTLCAERAALVNAVSAGEKEFLAIAVVADTKDPVPPCGACRQVLSEFSPEMLVVMSNIRGKSKISKLTQLLPDSFLIPRRK